MIWYGSSLRNEAQGTLIVTHEQCVVGFVEYEHEKYALFMGIHLKSWKTFNSFSFKK